MAGDGFHYVAKYCSLDQIFATTIITALQSAFNCTGNLCSQTSYISEGGSGLRQSALKFKLLTLAISSTTIFIVAIHGANTAICQHKVNNLSAEFSTKVKSSPHNFTLGDRLFEAFYILDL
jgi:hypothetical protein